MSKPKPGDIVVNHDVNIHPLLQIKPDKALIMTTKKDPASGAKTKPVEQHNVTDFSIYGEAYISNQSVYNDSGKVIGKTKSNFLTEVLGWVGVIVVIILLIVKYS